MMSELSSCRDTRREQQLCLRITPETDCAHLLIRLRSINRGKRHRRRPALVNDRSYAVTDPEGNVASGRAEDLLRFPEHLARCARCSGKQHKMYHAAAGEAGVWV